MIYLGDCPAVKQWDELKVEYQTRKRALEAEYLNMARRLGAEYESWYNSFNDEIESRTSPREDEILTYIRSHIPDCAWDKGKMVF